MENRVKLVGWSALFVISIIIFFMTYFTVDQSEMAVVTRFGNFDYVAGPGLHFKLPFVNAIQSYRTDIQSVASKNRVNTYTIDNQEVDVLFTIFYRLPAKNVEYIYANSRDYEALLQSIATDRLKAAMGQVNVQSVAEKRGELRDTIKATLQKDTNTLGIEVTDFQLTDLQYTDAFRQANNQASVQKAQIESREYERQQAEKVAATQVIQATGQANSVKAKADGDAYARIAQATAEAKAIGLQGEAQGLAIKAQADALKANPDLVNLRKAERWDGKLPTSMYAGAPIPFMSVNQ